MGRSLADSVVFVHDWNEDGTVILTFHGNDGGLTSRSLTFNHNHGNLNEDGNLDSSF